MSKIAALILGALALIFSGDARAQSGCVYIVPGAVLTAGQWNYCFAQKQDVIGFVPLNPGNLVGIAPVTVTPTAGVVQFALSYNSSLALDGSSNLGINLAHPNVFTAAQTIPTIYGQTIAAGVLTLQSTSNGSPSGDVVNVVGSTISLTGAVQINPGNGTIPSVPQPHPASGNLLCPSGFNGTISSSNHVLTWTDQSQCWTNDVLTWYSFDPSALLTIALSGTANTGDVETVVFHFSATTYTIQYTVQGGDSDTKIASCLVSNLASGCAGSGNFGILQGGTTQSAALYNNVAGSQGQILYVTSSGATISIDFNSAVTTYLSNTSTGSRITFAYGGAAGSQVCTSGTPCIAGLDNNPVIDSVRCASSGTSPPCVVPASGSVIWALNITGASSTGNADTTYGQIAMAITNSTAGSILGRMQFINKNHLGNDGFYINNGLCTLNYTCSGIDTFTTGEIVAPLIVASNAANAALQIQSTSNGLPSGDSMTLEASALTMRGYAGTTQVNCGVAAVSSCTFTMASAGGGVTNFTPANSASTFNIVFPAISDTLVSKQSTDTLLNKTITSSTDSIGGVTAAFGSDAKGDIYQNGGSSNVIVQLAIGAAGTILQPSGGLLAYTGAPTFTTSITTPIHYGGSGTGSTLTLQSTNNVSPSGDSLTIKASTINFLNYSGVALVNCGASGTISCQFTLAGSSSGAMTLIPQATASGTVTLPNGATTLAGLATVETFTAAQTFNIASTFASATAATLDDLKVSAATTTITGNTGSPITALSKVHLLQPTLTDSSAVTVTDAATLTIDNAPAQAGSVTITNAWALLVSAGAVKLGGTVFMTGLTSGSGTSALCLNATASQVETDTSATICGISALRYKDLIAEITPDQGLDVLGLRGESYTYKSTAPGHANDRLVHVSLIADDMAAMNHDCAEYSESGVENYMDRCFEAYQVAYDKKVWEVVGKLVDRLPANDDLRREVGQLRRAAR